MRSTRSAGAPFATFSWERQGRTAFSFWTAACVGLPGGLLPGFGGAPCGMRCMAGAEPGTASPDDRRSRNLGPSEGEVFYSRAPQLHGEHILFFVEAVHHFSHLELRSMDNT